MPKLGKSCFFWSFHFRPCYPPAHIDYNQRCRITNVYLKINKTKVGSAFLTKHSWVQVKLNFSSELVMFQIWDWSALNSCKVILDRAWLEKDNRWKCLCPSFPASSHMPAICFPSNSCLYLLSPTEFWTLHQEKKSSCTIVKVLDMERIYSFIEDMFPCI